MTRRRSEKRMELDEYTAYVNSIAEQRSERYCKSQGFKSPEEEQAELCRLTQWKDQIELGIFVCAECGKRVCTCGDAFSFEQLRNGIVHWGNGRMNRRGATR